MQNLYIWKESNIYCQLMLCSRILLTMLFTYHFFVISEVQHTQYIPQDFDGFSIRLPSLMPSWLSLVFMFSKFYSFVHHLWPVIQCVQLYFLKGFFSSLSCTIAIAKDQFTAFMQIYFSALCFVPKICLFFHQFHTSLMHFTVYLENEECVSPDFVILSQ